MYFKVRVKIWNDEMENDRYFEILKLRILKQRKMSYLIILFLIFFHFLEIIRIREMFDNFLYCKILIFQMVKLNKIS